MNNLSFISKNVKGWQAIWKRIKISEYRKNCVTSNGFLFFFFFSIHTYTHVQFEQLHKYIQKRNKIYKKWYTQKQSLDIKLFGISRKQTKKKKKKKQKGDVSS